MKKIVLLTIFLMMPLLAGADAGVVVESKGDVKITKPSGTKVTARNGVEFPDGSTISTGGNSSAVVFFKNGSIKRLGANQNLKATGTPKKADTTLFAAFSSAVKEVSKPSAGPRGQMMIKKVGKSSPGVVAFKNDLKKVDDLNLSPEGTALLKAEVYFKYSQYNSVVSTLKPFCAPKTCKNDTAKNLMRDSHIKLGNSKLARDY